MEKVDKILNHPVFVERMNEIVTIEKTRKFCCHRMDHLLDVARVAYIDVLENGYAYDRELVYSVALLHDIGRYSVLEKDGLTHHSAGAIVAKEILEDVGFSTEEVEYIQGIIRLHKYNDMPHDSLEYIIYNADKKVRNCFNCDASDECYWDEGKKNMTIWR